MANGTAGPPIGSQNAKTHGLFALRARGLGQLDGRSRQFRAYSDVKAELVTELGGAAEVTAQQSIIVDNIARELVFLDAVDSWLMGQETLLVGRGRQKKLLPVMAQRDAIVRRIHSGLSLIGLQRRAHNVTSAIDLLGEEA